MNGIASQRGKLPWPLKGRVLHNFGERQTGQIDWKGLVIDANYGQEVKAVYPGTIVFAEYLRGYGLVVLLDHGKGDMTLYGFNQTLLKKEATKLSQVKPLLLRVIQVVNHALPSTLKSVVIAARKTLRSGYSAKRRKMPRQPQSRYRAAHRGVD